MGELDLTEMSSIFVAIAIVLGMAVWHATSAVGENVGDSFLAWIGQHLPGGNPAQNSDEGLQLGA